MGFFFFYEIDDYEFLKRFPIENTLTICSKKFYLCKIGNVCINHIYVCDKIPDCPSNEDEIGCDYKEDELFFKCLNNNKRISYKLVCDFIQDCDDGSDEIECGREKKKFVEFVKLT